MNQQRLSIGPALAFFADTVFNRDAYIVKKDFIEMVKPVDGVNSAYGDPGAVHVD